jgi:hypothetical protein
LSTDDPEHKHMNGECILASVSVLVVVWGALHLRRNNAGPGDRQAFGALIC